MCSHIFDDPFKGNITAGMIAMVVRIDQPLEGFVGLFLQLGNKVFCRIRKLSINYYNSVFVRQPGDGSSLFSKPANVTTQCFELIGWICENGC